VEENYKEIVIQEEEDLPVEENNNELEAFDNQNFE
jgi:hypothetical protein